MFHFSLSFVFDHRLFTNDLCSILKAAGVEPVLDLPSVGENLAGKFHLDDKR